ncbi:hypothetical protein L798_14413 [Zootermopsis nevadensis]|uniref:Uncharacterized protein n=1 Tax=Zootermopsis nevadensis TaxID=136037 RepID=A0A067QPW5_ZOONE|nr:hypothetical protein L798_14413 [Zootermopsis nevadensis]
MIQCHVSRYLRHSSDHRYERCLTKKCGAVLLRFLMNKEVANHGRDQISEVTSYRDKWRQNFLPLLH